MDGPQGPQRDLGDWCPLYWYIAKFSLQGHFFEQELCVKYWMAVCRNSRFSCFCLRPVSALCPGKLASILTMLGAIQSNRLPYVGADIRSSQDWSRNCKVLSTDY